MVNMNDTQTLIKKQTIRKYFVRFISRFDLTIPSIQYSSKVYKQTNKYTIALILVFVLEVILYSVNYYT